MSGAKSSQLQIRVSLEEKAEIQRRAQALGLSTSAWVLRKLLPPQAMAFGRLCSEVAKQSDSSRYALAALNDFLTALRPGDFEIALGDSPPGLSPFQAAYLAAMIEVAASRKGVSPPSWAVQTRGVKSPYFATSLMSVRLHLLSSSPAPFKRRNLFIDSSVGCRV